MKVVKKIKLEVYPFFVVLMVGADKTEIPKELKKLGIYYTSDDYDESMRGEKDKAFAMKLDEPHDDDGYERAVFLFWIRQKTTDNRWRAIAQHESHHLCNEIMSHIGQEHMDFDDDEVFVYFNDYVFEKVLDITS